MASKEAIAKLSRQIFGTLPNKNIRTGHKILKKRQTAVLDARYYPEKIDSAARKVRTLHYINAFRTHSIIFFEWLACKIKYLAIKVLHGSKGIDVLLPISLLHECILHGQYSNLRALFVSFSIPFILIYLDFPRLHDRAAGTSS